MTHDPRSYNKMTLIRKHAHEGKDARGEWTGCRAPRPVPTLRERLCTGRNVNTEQSDAAGAGFALPNEDGEAISRTR